MTYKGAYDGSTEYAIGDVVVFDSVAYCKTKEAPAGTVPHNTLAWNRVAQPLQDVVELFHGFLNSLPTNIDDESIVLKTEDGEYMITVDDSGDTPELAVEAIEAEESIEAEGGD